MDKDQQQKTALVQERYLGTEFTYEVTQGTGYSVSRLSSVKFDEPIAPAPSAPSSPIQPPTSLPGQTPTKIIVFPSRSNGSSANPPANPGAHPGRVLPFPSHDESGRAQRQASALNRFAEAVASFLPRS